MVAKTIHELYNQNMTRNIHTMVLIQHTHTHVQSNYNVDSTCTCTHMQYRHMICITKTHNNTWAIWMIREYMRNRVVMVLSVPLLCCSCFMAFWKRSFRSPLMGVDGFADTSTRVRPGTGKWARRRTDGLCNGRLRCMREQKEKPKENTHTCTYTNHYTHSFISSVTP